MSWGKASIANIIILKLYDLNILECFSLTVEVFFQHFDDENFNFSMLASTFEKIYSQIQWKESIAALTQAYPSVPKDIIYSIYRLKAQETAMKTLKKHSSPHLARMYYDRYLEESRHDRDNNSLLVRLSRSINLPSCLVARIILEEHYSRNDGFADVALKIGKPGKPMKKQIGMLLKNPHLIEDEGLRQEVLFCLKDDDCYSPDAETMKRLIGEKHEAKLEAKLKSLGIPYQSEYWRCLYLSL